MGYVRLSEAADHFGVCTRTLIRWEAAGKIKVERSPGGKRIYDLKSLDPSSERASYIYTRVARRDLYERLWLPQKTDCVVSDSICSRGSSKDTVSASWFSNKTISLQRQSWQRTCSRSFRCSVVDGTGEDVTEEEQTVPKDEESEHEEAEELIRMRKVRILPKKYQKRMLNDWRHAARYSYNKAVFLMNETASFNKMYLRDLITPVEVNGDKPHLLKTPKDVRAAAVFEAAKNAKSCFSNRERGNITGFRFSFKTKKKEDSKGWCLGIAKTAVKRRGNRTLIIYGDYCPWEFETLGAIGEITKDCQLQFDGAKYYLLLPYSKTHPAKVKGNTKSLINETREAVIALDPGVRTFLTAYSPSEAYKLGDGCAQRLFSLAITLDRLLAFEKRIPKDHRKKQRAVRLRIIKTRRKIAHLRDEMHYKVADFLTRKAKIILLPTFETSEMVRRFQRRIGSKSVRQMSFLSHYKFKQRLIAKAAGRGVRVLIVSEHYTSKTCGRCGEVKQNLEGARTFKCGSCFAVIDRDCNGARNILLRAIRRK
ncbi:putative Transcription regulator HTH [Klebsormidium nitens]|uniref:Putative Transcription regulator HTH n=1 Tax=Klebsormidium nitens TaxID=105231 RepID=A0A1Y1IRN7_KLENI|nr:putative Transcription regulator HTH [Klebsormidium nitens]|eukprot:GAQ91406.1 putative Transcription regulator HTH [Klebsormidium nitens]